MSGKSWYTDEFRKQAIDMVKTGHPLQETALHLHVSREAVRNWFNAQPDVKIARTLAVKLRKAGTPCAAIVKLVNKEFGFKLKIQTIGSWTNPYVESRRKISENYWDKKARINWEFLKGWKRPHELPKYYRFKPI